MSCEFSLPETRQVLVWLGEVPNEGHSPEAGWTRRRNHVHAISSQQEGVLLKAHNIQILTILRLLGYDSGDTDTDLASHVMQIRTGEGKSIILGACSALFALPGFRVRCVCYSGLSEPPGLQPLREPLQGLRHREARRLQHDKEVQPGWSADQGQHPPACA